MTKCDQYSISLHDLCFNHSLLQLLQVFLQSLTSRTTVTGASTRHNFKLNTIRKLTCKTNFLVVDLDLVSLDSKAKTAFVIWILVINDEPFFLLSCHFGPIFFFFDQSIHCWCLILHQPSSVPFLVFFPFYCLFLSFF